MDGKAELDLQGGRKGVWRVEGEMERKAEEEGLVDFPLQRDGNHRMNYNNRGSTRQPALPVVSGIRPMSVSSGSIHHSWKKVLGGQLLRPK